MKTDAWKRPLPSAVDDCANVTCGYEQQLEFVFKPNDATPEQVQEWYNTCLIYTSPSPRDKRQSRMPSSA